MKRQRPALRTALLSIATVLTGFMVIAGFLGWRVYRYEAARHRATAVARGTVVDGQGGGAGTIQVRWTDDAGRAHEQDFPIYNPDDRYHKGRTFLVAYDPANPAPQGFPAGPGARTPHNNLAGPIGAAGGVAAVLIMAWAGRGLWFRRAAVRPGRRMLATTLYGQRRTAPAWLGGTVWISLADPAEPARPIRWQRVMWHPATPAGTVDRPQPVTVHGNPAGRHRVVVETPGGVTLVPVGRLRHRWPRWVRLREPIGIDDALVVPAGAARPRPQPWWRPAVLVALAAAPFGMGVGFVVGGAAGVVPVAAAACAPLVNGWAFAGTAP